jgi:hypothetical protein
MLRRDPLLEGLWSGEINWICLQEAGSDGSGAEAARGLEMLLDYVAFRAGTPAFLLDPRFAALQTPAEEALAALLEPLVDAGEAARALRGVAAGGSAAREARRRGAVTIFRRDDRRQVGRLQNHRVAETVIAGAPSGRSNLVHPGEFRSTRLLRRRDAPGSSQ